MNDNISIRLVDSWPTNEIIDLYKAGGWWKDTYDPSLVKDMIIGSFAFAIVVDTSRDKAIGMGRVLSDGISDAYIQDLIILPDYRNNGLGKKLVNHLIKKCLTHGIVWIGVIAEPGSENFYNKFGFKQMMGYTPMLFKKVD